MNALALLNTLENRLLVHTPYSGPVTYSGIFIDRFLMLMMVLTEARTMRIVAVMTREMMGMIKLDPSSMCSCDVTSPVEGKIKT